MTVEQAENVLLDAILKGDLNRLDQLLSDNLIFTSHTGTLLSKADDLAAHRTGLLKLTQAISSELTVRPLQNGAVTNVRVVLKGHFDSKPFSGEFRYTRVWEERGGDWKVIAAHVSEITN